MKKEVVQQQQQQPQGKEMEGNGSPRTGGLVQGRQKRTRKLRMEVDWTLLLLPPSPKGARRKRGRKEAVTAKAKISKKKAKKQVKTQDKQNQD